MVYEAKKALEEALLDALPKEKAESVLRAIQDFVEASCRDLRDDIKQEGDYDPEW